MSRSTGGPTNLLGRTLSLAAAAATSKNALALTALFGERRRDNGTSTLWAAHRLKADRISAATTENVRIVTGVLREGILAGRKCGDSLTGLLVAERLD